MLACGGASPTTRLMVVVRETSSAAAVMVSVYVPSGVAVPHSAVVIVRLAELSHAGLGPKAAALPGGSPSIERSTGLASPVRPSVTVYVATEPRCTVRQPGAADTTRRPTAASCHAGSSSTALEPPTTTSVGHEPSGRIVESVDRGPPRPAYTSLEPSGAHAGSAPPVVAAVSFLSDEPSPLTT